MPPFLLPRTAIDVLVFGNHYSTLLFKSLSCKSFCFQTTSYKKLPDLSFSFFLASRAAHSHLSSRAPRIHAPCRSQSVRCLFMSHRPSTCCCLFPGSIFPCHFPGEPPRFLQPRSDGSLAELLCVTLRCLHCVFSQCFPGLYPSFPSCITPYFGVTFTRLRIPEMSERLERILLNLGFCHRIGVQ